MKKILTIAAAVMLLASPAANAQGLLGRIAEKAGQAVSSKISEKVNEKVSEKTEAFTDKLTDRISETTGVDIKAMSNSSSTSIGGMPVPDSRETLQPRRSSSFGWDGVVTPSSAQFPIPLMNEFPAVPSAAKLANPTEADQIAFYKAVKAVTLRAEELNSDSTCGDDFAEKWRKEAEDALCKAYGLTAAEMEALKSGNLSPAEEERLVNKMRTAILGGYSEDQLMAEAKKAEGMTQSDVENMAVAASDAVFDRHAAELPKYTGCTAAEYKAATRESMNGNDSAASRAIEAKAEKYIAALPAAQKKEAQAFMNTLKQELAQAALASVPGAGMALNLAQSFQSFQSKLSPLQEKYAKIEKFGKDIQAAWPDASSWSDADAKFSETERKKVENIRNQIAATNDANVYNPLYLQAMEVIKTYRERAAQVWAADVQKRFDTVKNGMGNIIKICRQAIEEEVLPECALYRIPFNLVIEAGDILADAYSEFPSNYPHMYNEEVVRQLKIDSGEHYWWPEFYVSSDLESVLAGKNMFKESNGKVYQFNKGSWSPVPDNFEQQAAPAASKPASAKWTSSDGKREVIYNAEGGFLQFPEGDIVYPVAWEKQGNNIVWAEIDDAQMQDGSVQYKIVKCTYKL